MPNTSPSHLHSTPEGSDQEPGVRSGPHTPGTGHSGTGAAGQAALADDVSGASHSRPARVGGDSSAPQVSLDGSVVETIVAQLISLQAQMSGFKAQMTGYQAQVDQLLLERDHTQSAPSREDAAAEFTALPAKTAFTNVTNLLSALNPNVDSQDVPGKGLIESYEVGGHLLPTNGRPSLTVLPARRVHTDPPEPAAPEPPAEHEDNAAPAENKAELATPRAPYYDAASVLAMPTPVPVTVMSRSHADFSLREVNAASLAKFYTECCNALQVDPSFNVVPRIRPEIRARVLDRHLIQSMKASAEPGQLFTNPGASSHVILEDEDLHKIGARGPPGFELIMQYLVQCLGNREQQEEDITMAFQTHRLHAFTSEGIRAFNHDIKSKNKIYFKMLQLDASDGLQRAILTERWAHLRQAAIRSGTTQRFLAKLEAHARHCADEDKNAYNNIDIFCTLITLNLDFFDEQLPGFSHARAPVGTVQPLRTPESRHGAARSNTARARQPINGAKRAYSPVAPTNDPSPMRPPHRAQGPSRREASREPVNARSAPIRAPIQARKTAEKPVACFQCGAKGERSGHKGCEHPVTPSAAGLAARARAAKSDKTYWHAAMTPTDDTASEKVTFHMAAIIHHPNFQSHLHDLEDSHSDTEMETNLSPKEGSLSDSDNETPSDSEESDVGTPLSREKKNPLRATPEIQPLKQPRSTNFITSIIAMDKLTSGIWDTAACNGNWITVAEAKRLDCQIEKVPQCSFVSPLFPDKTFVSNSAVTLTLEFPEMGFKIPNVLLRLLHESEAAHQTPIILGQDLINNYGILNYITNPLLYRRIEPPTPAPEESLDTTHCILPFTAAILDATSIPKLTDDANPKPIRDYDYDTPLHIDPKFPLRERALNILRKFDKSVLVDHLDNSDIRYEPMQAKLRKPFNGVPPRRLNMAKQKFLDNWLAEALKRKIIRPSNVTKTSPLLLVPKPPGPNNYRVTQDVSVLNDCLDTIHAAIPITRDLVSRIGAHNWYFQFDLVDCYYQFRVDPAVSQLYAFSTHKGNYEYTDVLPQGEKNAPAWVNNAMSHLLAPLPYMNYYFDDHCTGHDDACVLLDRLHDYLTLCLHKNIKLARKKVRVGVPELNTLGFMISKKGYRPRETQLKKFLSAPFPAKDQLRSWFGLLNVFRDFLPDMAPVEAAFSAVRKKNAPYIITPEMTEAFNYAKEQVANIQVLAFPDDNRELYVDADASQFGCGAMLYQEDPQGTKIPLRFMAHTFTAQAVKWSTIEKECYSLVKAFQTFENLLLGRDFTVRTDHRNLLWMQHSVNQKVQRWFCYLYQFSFALEHIPGAENVVADAMSRIFATTHLTPTLTAPLEELSPLSSAVALINPVQEWTYDRAKAFFLSMHGPYGEHPGIKNTLKAFQEAKCNFPHLKQQIIRWIADCAVCTKARALRSGSPARGLEYHTINSFEPFTEFQMDFLVGLPASASGMTSVLVMVCSFTRFTILYACPDQSAESACNGLLYLWGMFSVPRMVTTDNASCFIADTFQRLCAMLRVTHRTTLAHHPQAHGIVERMNREVQAVAKKVIGAIDEATHENWPHYLPAVQRALNTRTHTATGYAPCHLVFGTKVTKGFDALASDRADLALVPKETPIPRYLRLLDETLALVVEHGLVSTEDRILKNYLRAKRDQPKSPRKFKVGDFVFITNTRPITRRLGKFAPNYCGPLKVIQDYGNDIYQLQDVVQDQDTFYTHAIDMVQSSIADDAVARDVARVDYAEFFIHEVVSHEADPEDPDKLGQLWFHVRFTGDNHTILCPYVDVKHVDVVKDYIRLHKNELPKAYMEISRAVTPLGVRSRKISQRLAGYDLQT